MAERANGLELVSAPVTLSMTVGHVAYLPVEVWNYHRAITVSAQTLIHTYVNDVTPDEPGDSPAFFVGTLTTSQSELQLQTLRMRPHALTLIFAAGEGRSLREGSTLSHTLTLEPALQPRTPLFSTHPDTPVFMGLQEPFTPIWGPDCAPCPTTPGDPISTTRVISCAKQLADSCRCRPIQMVLDHDTEVRVRRRAPALQRYAFQFVRGVGGWGSTQIAPDRYLWNGLDWLFYRLVPQERDYSPLLTGVMDGNFGWMTCPTYTNPDGSVGFYDPSNAFLLKQYSANIYAVTARYQPELRFVELSNEPAAEFYLCPCTVPGPPDCDATVGPDQPACLTGPNSPEFVAAYGDLLFTAVISASQAMKAANPEALLVTGALEMSPNDFGLTLTTMDALSRGMLMNDNVILGIHQYPYLLPSWLSPIPNCSYYQKPGDPYWLPSGCETAPPFEDFSTPTGKPVAARAAWQQFDQRVDSSLLLHDAETLGVLDRFYLFDTELHAGFHDADPTTTPAREAIAGLRIGAINAHQRVIGTEYIFAPADPTPYNLLVKHLAGVTPIYQWDAPLMDADYSALVYKLFTRSNEDIIAVWSNYTTTLTFCLSPGAAQFKRVTLTRLADAGGPLAIATSHWVAPPTAFPVRPLTEFYFLSVISDRPGFGWLEDIAVIPANTRVSLPYVLRDYQ